MIKINPKTIHAYQLMHRGVLALSRAEQFGIRIDLEYAQAQMKILSRRIQRAEDLFRQTTLYKHWEHVVKGKTINIHSAQQLAHFLYNVKKLKPFKYTESGQGAVDDESLQYLGIPELDYLAEAKKLKKIRDTYLDGFLREQVDGVLHPVFNLHLVTTFRSSSDHPNFQNIPKRDADAMRIVRKALKPRPGHQLLEADFAAMEVRVSACYNRDSNLLKYIKDPSTDMHRDVAQQIFKIKKFDSNIPGYSLLRSAAKNGFTFPQFYGSWYKNCAEILATVWGKLPQETWKSGQGIPLGDTHLSDHLIKQGIKSYDAFVEHLRLIEKDFWGNRFPEYAEWKDRAFDLYKKYGYVDMYTGFRCSGVMARNDSINYPIQGSAFHCLLWVFTRLDEITRTEGWDSRLIGQIHDSMVWDVHPDEFQPLLLRIRDVISRELPEHWKWIAVPMDCDFEYCEVDEPWSEKKKLKF